MQLYEYKNYYVPFYLDGRYFHKVIQSVDRMATTEEPIIFRIVDGEPRENIEKIMSSISFIRDVVYIRMILEIFETNEDGIIDLVRRHSNLIIADLTKNNTIILTRFEPLSNLDELYNDIINETFKELDMFDYEGYFVIESHPQKNETDTMCNAYVLKYAYFDLMNKPIGFESNAKDIKKFARSVIYMYGPLNDDYRGGKDIELGGNNTLFGGLAGAGIGFAIGGPAGLLVGGAAGGYLGSKSDQSNKKKEQEKKKKGKEKK